MTSICCTAPLDYVYATWHCCRACGRLTSVVPPQTPSTAKVELLDPFPINEVTRRGAHSPGAMPVLQDAPPLL